MASNNCCKSTVLKLQGCPCQNKTPVWPKGKVLLSGCSWRKCLLTAWADIWFTGWKKGWTHVDTWWCSSTMIAITYLMRKHPETACALLESYKNSRVMTHYLDSKEQPFLFAEHKGFSLWESYEKAIWVCKIFFVYLSMEIHCHRIVDGWIRSWRGCSPSCPSDSLCYPVTWEMTCHLHLIALPFLKLLKLYFSYLKGTLWNLLIFTEIFANTKNIPTSPCTLLKPLKSQLTTLNKFYQVCILFVLSETFLFFLGVVSVQCNSTKSWICKYIQMGSSTPMICPTGKQQSCLGKAIRMCTNICGMKFYIFL